MMWQLAEHSPTTTASWRATIPRAYTFFCGRTEHSGWSLSVVVPVPRNIRLLSRLLKRSTGVGLRLIRGTGLIVGPDIYEMDNHRIAANDAGGYIYILSLADSSG